MSKNGLEKLFKNYFFSHVKMERTMSRIKRKDGFSYDKMYFLSPFFSGMSRLNEEKFGYPMVIPFYCRDMQEKWSDSLVRTVSLVNDKYVHTYVKEIVYDLLLEKKAFDKFSDYPNVRITPRKVSVVTAGILGAIAQKNAMRHATRNTSQIFYWRVDCSDTDSVTGFFEELCEFHFLFDYATTDIVRYCVLAHQKMSGTQLSHLIFTERLKELPEYDGYDF